MSTSPPGPRASIECWFDFGSNYSYLALMRIEALAARAGVAIAWRPFLLGPIFQSFGWTTSPFVSQPQKGEYTWRDMARQCDKHGLPWTRPSTFPRRAILATRVALASEQQPWIGEFCRRIISINFVDDGDIDNEAVVCAVLDQLGVDSAALVRAVQTDQARAALRARTAEAQARGIFGAPSFFVNGELFWGNDRLEDALAWAER